jgi:hypothetical protein
MTNMLPCSVHAQATQNKYSPGIDAFAGSCGERMKFTLR